MLTKRYPTLNHMVEDVIGFNNHLWGSFDGLLQMAPIPVALNPSVEIHEENGKLNYLVDMPGISKDQVSALQEGDYLRIQGERTNGSSKSHFSTTIKVPAKVKAETLQASMRDGVLTLSFDVKGKEELHPSPKRIEIGSGEDNNAIGASNKPAEMDISSHGS